MLTSLRLTPRLTTPTTLARSARSARALSTTTPAKMPLYVAYCPDYPDNLQTRLSVRDAHLADATEDKKTGASVFGRAFLNDAVSTHEAGKPAADQLPGMDGSVMILRFPTIEEAWARIKADKYWTGGVWDKDKVMVREIIGAPGVDETIKIQ